MSTWCSKHVETWNKLIVKQTVCIKLVNYYDKYSFLLFRFSPHQSWEPHTSQPCIWLVTAWLLIALAVNVPMLYAGRVVAGFCVGVVSLCFPVYLGETLQPEVRGMLGLLPTAFGNVGKLAQPTSQRRWMCSISSGGWQVSLQRANYIWNVLLVHQFIVSTSWPTSQIIIIIILCTITIRNFVVPTLFRETSEVHRITYSFSYFFFTCCFIYSIYSRYNIMERYIQ